MSGEIYGYPAKDVTRNFLFNTGSYDFSSRLVLIVFSALCVFWIINTFYKRLHKFRNIQQSVDKGNIKKRILFVLKYIFVQSHPLKNFYETILQSFITVGATIFFFLGILALIQSFITGPFFHHIFIRGYSYLFYTFAGDFSAFLILVGIIMALYKRVVIKPERLTTTKSNIRFLLFVLVVIFLGYTEKAFRLLLTGMPSFESPAFISFKYATFLGVLFSSFSEGTIEEIHYFFWWASTLSIFFFFGTLVSKKAGNAFFSILNVYKTDPDEMIPDRKFSTEEVSYVKIYSGDRCGRNKITDFSRKDLIEAESCTECGRCQELCPSYLSEKPLSPKKLMFDFERCIKNNVSEEDELSPKEMIEEYIDRDEIWACTICAACAEVCPVKINPMSKIIEMRRFDVLENAVMPGYVRDAYYRYEYSGNLYGTPAVERNNYLLEDGLCEKIVPGKEYDLIYFPGCSVTRNSETAPSATAILKVLSNAGLKIGIIGEEVCCGEYFLKTGNHMLYLDAAIKNLKLFKKHGVKNIITGCPHCYNTFKKEYVATAKNLPDSMQQEINTDFNVFHTTQLFGDLLNSGKISFKNDYPFDVVFHDPCYLSRYNGIHSLPREVLLKIPGLKILEMGRSKETSLCCGNKILYRIKDPTIPDMNDYRAKEAYSTGAAVLITACPECHMNLTMAAKKIQAVNFNVVDFSELIAGLIE